MQRLGPWFIVLILAGGVAFTYFKYINPKGDKEAAADASDAEEKPPIDNTGQQASPPPPVRQTGQTETGQNDRQTEIDQQVNQQEPNPGASQLFRQASELMKTDPERGAEIFQLLIELNRGSEEAIQAAAMLGAYYFDNKEAAKAKEYLSIALNATIASEQRIELEKRLNALKADLNASLGTFAEFYQVKPGDVLSRIGTAHDIPHKLIMRLNNMKDTTIRVDQRLRVVRGPFHVVVEKSKLTLSVYLGDNFVKSYPVGLGAHDSTPAGEWFVESKLVEPVWYRPGRTIPYGDPENALGTRWIGFMKGYGIHGTWEPDTVGKTMSEGCVRMYNKDVEELFDLLIKGKSKITIRP